MQGACGLHRDTSTLLTLPRSRSRARVRALACYANPLCRYILKGEPAYRCASAPAACSVQVLNLLWPYRPPTLVDIATHASRPLPSSFFLAHYTGPRRGGPVSSLFPIVMCRPRRLCRATCRALRRVSVPPVCLFRVCCCLCRGPPTRTPPLAWTGRCTSRPHACAASRCSLHRFAGRNSRVCRLMGVCGWVAGCFALHSAVSPT